MSNYYSSKMTIAAAVMFVLITGNCIAQQLNTVRIKDIGTIHGVRDNQLVGIGLVTGLAGRGDTPSSVITKTSISNLLSEFGMTISPDDIRSKNTAIVTVTAVIPPFSAAGDRIDIHVASIADATDISGGVLLQTPLRAVNGENYAVAQGVVSTARGADSIKTTGTIPGGAIIERDVSSDFLSQEKIMLILNRSDFTTVTAVTNAINAFYPDSFSKAVNASLVEMTIPEDMSDKIVEFISGIEQIEIVPDISAKIVIDERAGIIVLGGDVRISPVAISYKRNEVRIRPVSVYEEAGETSFVFNDMATVGDFISVLQELDVDTETIIEMIKLMDRAGVIYGTLSIE